MTFETDQVVGKELQRGERILWSGMPCQGLKLSGGDFVMIPFSLLWGGFALFWEWEVVHQARAPAFMKLWGIPFVLIGLYLIVGRFFADAFQRAKTYYAITDQRVLIIGGLFTREITSLSLRALGEVSLQERGDRSGSLVFGPSSATYAMFRGTAWPGMSKRLPPAFDRIDGVRSVYTVLQDAQRRASTATSA